MAKIICLVLALFMALQPAPATASDDIRRELIVQLGVLAVGTTAHGVLLIVLLPDAPVPTLPPDQPYNVLRSSEIVAYTDGGRYRPLHGGISAGNADLPGGTLGGVVYDLNGQKLLLSSAHAFAGTSEAILQPAVQDGGIPGRDRVAALRSFIPLKLVDGLPSEEDWNLVDAALATPECLAVPDILEIGRVTGARPAYLGQAVMKRGRTSELTTGQVFILDAAVKIAYEGGTGYFEHQFLTGPMAAPGDSGSILVDGGLRATGLLVGGSDVVTVYSPIEFVTALLEVSFQRPQPALFSDRCLFLPLAGNGESCP